MSKDWPAPGSTQYLPALVDRLIYENGSSFPPQIFASIYLCLISGHEKHLILQTRDEDIADVKALVVRVICIFGLPTQRIQVRKDDGVDDFQNGMFLVPPPAAAPFGSRRRSRKHRQHRPSSGSRYRSVPVGSSLAGSVASTSQLQANLGAQVHQHLLQQDWNSSLRSATDDGTITSHSRQHSGTSTITTGLTMKKRRSRSALSPDDSSTKAIRPQSTHGFHIETNPPTPNTPFSPLPPLLSPGEYPPAQMPTYVSTSTNVPRLPHALVLSKLEKSGPPIQDCLTEILRTKRIIFENDATEGWEDLFSSVGRAEHDAQGNTLDTNSNAWDLPEGFIVVCIMPLSTGKVRPPLKKSLLDKFSFCAPIRLERNVYNTTPGPFRRTSLISQEHIEHLREISTRTHISSHLDTYISSLLCAARHHPSLDGELLSARSVIDFTDLVKASRVVFGFSSADRTSRSTAEYVDEVAGPLGSLHKTSLKLSATEVDARRMLPFALDHRLSLRKHPGEGILGSIFRPVVGNDANAIDGVGKDGSVYDSSSNLTVHAVLEEILDDV